MATCNDNTAFCFLGKNKLFFQRKQIVFQLKTSCFSSKNKLFFQEKQGLQEKHKKMMRGHLMFFFIHSIKKIG